MKYEIYFKDLLESMPDYRKVVFLMFLNKIDVDLLVDIGFSGKDFNRLSFEFKNFLYEQFEDYLNYIKNEDESLIEEILNKEMENDVNQLSLELTISKN